MKKPFYFFLTISILASFTTRTFGESGILARIAFPDIAGALAIVFFFFSGEKLIVNQSTKAAFVLIIAFGVGIFVTKVLNFTIVELLILFFLALSAAVMYTVYRSKDGFDKLLKLIIYASLLASAAGFYGFVAMITGLPDIFSERAPGEVLSGFRNAGQAGAYALVLLTILMPLRSSPLRKRLDAKHQRLLNIAVTSLIIFLFLTGKIAGYIGFVFCLLFSALQKRKIAYFALIAVISGLISIIWLNLDSIAPGVHTRISEKYKVRVTEYISGENLQQGSFLVDNLSGAFRVFEDHPFTGSGIGGYYTVYDNYEVHSTYFKLLGETGAIGTFAYIYFIIALFSNFKGVSKIRKKNPYADYLWNMLPFLCGCFISWGYTYHLRKREFWILFAVICITSYLKKSLAFEQSLLSVKKDINTPLVSQ